MRLSSPFLCGFLAAISTLSGAERTNVLLICIDDLRPELGCYGVSHVQSPHIDGLASQGRVFKRHYVQAPTCGASRYALLTGKYGPADNEALVQRAKAMKSKKPVPVSLPECFRQAGYATVAVGKVSHHPGGWGGEDWDDTDIVEMPGAWDRALMPCGPWKTPKGAMHGLADGEVRSGRGTMKVYQSKDVPDTGYPDGLITGAAIGELGRLAADREKPFFLAVGLIRPHLPFGAPAKYYDIYRNKELPPVLHPGKPEGETTWHASAEFHQYDLDGRDPNRDAAFATEVRKHYAACVSYADAQVGQILAALDASGVAGRTMVVLWGDHGWHLGEHAVWGKHTLFEESLRSPLIVRVPGMEKPGIASEGIVETVDLFPTLCEAAEIPIPPGLAGVSLSPQLTDPAVVGGEAFSYFGDATTLRTPDYRIVLHRKGGHVELYDHRSDPGETRNVAADHPEEVARLRDVLVAKQAKR